MTREAFELSEKHKMPVLLRIVTRLAHSRGVVLPRSAHPVNPMSKARNSQSWILLPSNARRQWHERLCSEAKLKAEFENSSFNSLKLNDRDLGVITTGTAKNYYLEVEGALKTKPSHLHIGAYPFPALQIRQLAEHVNKLLILEEGYPYLERLVRGVGPSSHISGRMSGEVPVDGELNADLVRTALGIPIKTGLTASEFKVPGRPPQLCPGCPHIDSYAAMKEALSSFGESIVTADIGCYTLGAMPEYNAIESCVCMGASIGMAKGASESGLRPAIAVIGDSTFFHSGMTALVDAISVNSNMTVVILDNETTGMTGGQSTILPPNRIKNVVLGLGVNPEHVHVLQTHRTKLHENAAVIKREIDYPGLSVIIAVRECIETAKRKKATS